MTVDIISPIDITKDIVITAKYPSKLIVTMIYDHETGKLKLYNEHKMTWWERLCDH